MAQQEPPRKRARSTVASASSSSIMLQAEDWVTLVQTYKRKDEAREMVIKRCRDMQVIQLSACMRFESSMQQATAQPPDLGPA